MNIELLNNRKYKRPGFAGGLWYRHGAMFPYEHRKFIQIGLFGHVISIHYGKLF